MMATVRTLTLRAVVGAMLYAMMAPAAHAT